LLALACALGSQRNGLAKGRAGRGAKGAGGSCSRAGKGGAQRCGTCRAPWNSCRGAARTQEARAEICEFRREKAAMRTESATRAAREVELEREIARLEDDRLRTCDREADANRRAQDSEALLARTRITVEELRKQLSQTEIAQALAAAQLAQATKERNELQREKEAAAEARRRKANDRRKTATLGHCRGRTTSAPRPRFTSFPESVNR